MPFDSWIKFRKNIRGLPEMQVMARRVGDLLEAAGYPRPPVNFLLTYCVGAVGILWITGDDATDELDTLAMGAQDIDQLTGLKHLSELLPRNWFQVVGPDRVKLPDFHKHNGTLAKKKASAVYRQRRSRSRRRVTEK
jgi:hypothetical protein